jgi:hypothetical protein
MYLRISHDKHDENRTQSVGIKVRVARLNADIHQRQQQQLKIVEYEKRKEKEKLPASGPGHAFNDREDLFGALVESLTSGTQDQGMGGRDETRNTELGDYSAWLDDLLSVRKEKVVKAKVHKALYAWDVCAEDIEAKLLICEFAEESHRISGHAVPLGDFDHPKVSEMSDEDASWFNYDDYVDAGFKPLDHNPKMHMADLGRAPAMEHSGRTQARQTTPQDGQSLNEEDGCFLMESTKFGHEESHQCLHGLSPGVGPTQIAIARKRIKELMDGRAALLECPDDVTVCHHL